MFLRTAFAFMLVITLAAPIGCGHHTNADAVVTDGMNEQEAQSAHEEQLQELNKQDDKKK